MAAMVLLAAFLTVFPRLASGAEEAFDPEAAGARFRREQAFDSQAAESLVKAFLAVCPKIARDRNNAFSAAKTHRWKKQEVSGDNPDASDPNTATWLVTDVATVPFLLSVTSIPGGSDPRAICAVENPDAPPGLVTSVLGRSLREGVPLGSRIEGEVKIDEWLVDRNSFQISVTTRSTLDRGVKLMELQESDTATMLLDAYQNMYEVSSYILVPFVISFNVLQSISIPFISLYGNSATSRPNSDNSASSSLCLLNSTLDVILTPVSGLIDALNIGSMIAFLALPVAVLDKLRKISPSVNIAVKSTAVASSLVIWAVLMLGLHRLVGFPIWAGWLVQGPNWC